jgi:hypothetical protein
VATGAAKSFSALGCADIRAVPVMPANSRSFSSIKRIARRIAKEILRAIKRYGEIAHEDVVRYLEICGSQFLTESRTGRHVKIDPKLLSVFGEMSGDTVVWCRRSLRWRLRQKRDEPGRIQDE